MAVYLTELSPRPVHYSESIQLEKAKDKYINYLLQEEAQFANLELIEEELNATSIRLQQKENHTSIILNAKRKELDELTYTINCTLNEVYQFKLGNFRNVNLDTIILQTRELIKIKEIELDAYVHMKSRLYNTKNSMKNRIDEERKYEKATHNQSFSYKIIHNKASKDLEMQSKMYMSLTQHGFEIKESFSKETKRKKKLLRHAQEGLKEKKELFENKTKYYNNLLQKKSYTVKLIDQTKQCNLRQYHDLKYFRNQYYKNRMKLFIVIYALSTKKLKNIIFEVNDIQKKQNQFFQEYLYLNRTIAKYSDLNGEYDSTLSDINNCIQLKERREMATSTEFNGILTEMKDIKIKKMKFCNNQLLAQSMSKEAFIESLTIYLNNKRQVLINNSFHNNNLFDTKEEIGMSTRQLISQNYDYDLASYSSTLVKFNKIFNEISYHLLALTYNSMKAIAKSNQKKLRNLVISFHHDLISNQYNLNILKVINTMESNEPLCKKIHLSSNFNKTNNSISNKDLRKTHCEVMFNFRSYLSNKKDKNTYNYLTNFPKRTLNNLSKYYGEISGEITSASSLSIKNLNTTNNNLIGFNRRLAYIPFKASSLAKKKDYKMKSYSTNRSEYELNDDSYELSNINSSLQTHKDWMSSNKKLQRNETDLNKIKARMNDIYKMEVRVNNKHTQKNTEQLMEAYFKYETKKKNRRYNLQSSYSIKNLMRPLSNRDLMTPSLYRKNNRIDSSSYPMKHNLSSTDNKNISHSKPTSCNNTKNTFFTELQSPKLRVSKKNNCKIFF